MTAVTYARLRATDPARWRASATAWRGYAELAEQCASMLRRIAARIGAVWSGTAARAAAARLERLRGIALLIRVVCWAAERAEVEFATALGRARDLLAQGRRTAARAGLSIDDDGRVVAPGRRPDPARPLWSAFEAAPVEQAARRATREIAAALETAAEADEATARRLAELCRDPAPAPPGRPLPRPGASAAEVGAWWERLTPAQHRWLAATEPAWLSASEGVPPAYRALADELRQAVAAAKGRP